MSNPSPIGKNSVSFDYLAKSDTITQYNQNNLKIAAVIKQQLIEPLEHLNVKPPHRQLIVKVIDQLKSDISSLIALAKNQKFEEKDYKGIFRSIETARKILLSDNHMPSVETVFLDTTQELERIKQKTSSTQEIGVLEKTGQVSKQKSKKRVHPGTLQQPLTDAQLQAMVDAVTAKINKRIEQFKTFQFQSMKKLAIRQMIAATEEFKDSLQRSGCDKSLYYEFLQLFIEEVGQTLSAFEEEVMPKRENNSHLAKILIENDLEKTEDKIEELQNKIKDLSQAQPAKWQPEQIRQLDKLQHELLKKTQSVQESKKKIKSTNLLRMYYNKVLDKAMINLPTLASWEGRAALQSIISDFEAYCRTMHDHPYAQVIDEMKFASAIDIWIKSTVYTSPDLQSAEFEKLTTVVVNKAGQLKPGEGSVFFSGGTESHAVIFQIAKEPDGLFSFTTINTGVGAKLIAKEFDYVIDRKFKGITKEELALCVKDLLRDEASLPNDVKYDMDAVNRTIAGHFLGKEDRQGGRKHRMQHKGTCTVRSVLSWLHGRIGREAFKQFKPFMIQRAQDAFRKISPELLDDPEFADLAFGTRNIDLAKEYYRQMDEAGRHEHRKYVKSSSVENASKTESILLDLERDLSNLKERLKFLV